MAPKVYQVSFGVCGADVQEMGVSISATLGYDDVK